MDETPSIAIPADVLARIEATVEELLATPGILGFAIGTSGAPELEAEILGADAVVSVFRSESADEAGQLARWLTARVGDRAAARPSLPSRLGGALGDPWTSVYVALWAEPDLPPP